MPVALGDIARFGERTALVVPRFDRQPAADGTWLVQLPQEDLAQVCGVGPDTKYEADGGPGIAAVLERLLGSAQATADRLDFFRTQALFWMLAAVDGHAKNCSVFIEPRGHFRLTPRYDVLSACPELGHSKVKLAPEKIKMAIAVWGANRPYKWSEIRRPHFEQTAKDCGLDGAVSALIDALIERTPAVITQVAAALPAGFPDTVSTPILEACTGPPSVWEPAHRPPESLCFASETHASDASKAPASSLQTPTPPNLGPPVTCTVMSSWLPTQTREPSRYRRRFTPPQPSHGCRRRFGPLQAPKLLAHALGDLGHQHLDLPHLHCSEGQVG